MKKHFFIPALGTLVALFALWAATRDHPVIALDPKLQWERR